MRGSRCDARVVGLVGLVAAKLTRNYVVNSLVAQRDDRQAASNAWNILTDLMRGSFRLMIVVGILFLVAAWLAGPGPSGTDHARMDRSRRSAIASWAYGALAIVGLFLLLNAQVTDFTRVLFVLIIVALGATWIEITRRQTLREFPDTGEHDRRLRRARADVRLVGRDGGASAPRAVRLRLPRRRDVAARLGALADLHTNGHLTDEEYAAAKAKVLAGE